MGCKVKAKTHGFTLLELLVVIVIIGLLAAYVGPKYFSQLDKSQLQVARAQIAGFDKALDQYRIDTGHYPSTDQGLEALVKSPSNEPMWRGPYLKKSVPLDPWGMPYIYNVPGTDTQEFEVISHGKDKVAGGTGDGADITNWN